MTKMFLSKKEFCDSIGVSLRTGDNLIACKEVSVRRIGRRVLIPISEAEKFAKRDHATRPQPKVEPFIPSNADGQSKPQACIPAREERNGC
jgi:hypothetical protein